MKVTRKNPNKFKRIVYACVFSLFFIENKTLYSMDMVFLVKKFTNKAIVLASRCDISPKHTECAVRNLSKTTI